jgi:RNA polymerase sigma factor (TIGR02999 family)
MRKNRKKGTTRAAVTIAAPQKNRVPQVMNVPHGESVTSLLAQWAAGDAAALDSLIPLIHEDLHRIAARHLRQERPEHTLQATALINEVWLRLVGEQTISWQNRAHFFGVSAEIMRRILVDHARRKQAGKRGGGIATIALDENLDWSDERDLSLVALDDALVELALLDPQQSKVVELRFFAGLTVEETAEVMGLSPTTIKREWRTARAWLLREMAKST